MDSGTTKIGWMDEFLIWLGLRNPEDYCDRCGEYSPWNGEDNSNICGSCQGEIADHQAEMRQDR